MTIRSGMALSAACLTVSAGISSTALAGPDLVVDLSELNQGALIVTNIGDADAPNSITTLSCENLTGPNGCGDPPAAFEAHFSDPAYPDAAVVRTRNINAGASARVNIPFWRATTFASGDDLQFTAAADAGNDVAEDDETNNNAITTLNF